MFVRGHGVQGCCGPLAVDPFRTLEAGGFRQYVLRTQRLLWLTFFQSPLMINLAVTRILRSLFYLFDWQKRSTTEPRKAQTRGFGHGFPRYVSEVLFKNYPDAVLFLEYQAIHVRIALALSFAWIVWLMGATPAKPTDLIQRTPKQIVADGLWVLFAGTCQLVLYAVDDGLYATQVQLEGMADSIRHLYRLVVVWAHGG